MLKKSLLLFSLLLVVGCTAEQPKKIDTPKVETKVNKVEPPKVDKKIETPKIEKPKETKVEKPKVEKPKVEIKKEIKKIEKKEEVKPIKKVEKKVVKEVRKKLPSQKPIVKKVVQVPKEKVEKPKAIEKKEVIKKKETVKEKTKVEKKGKFYDLTHDFIFLVNTKRRLKGLPPLKYDKEMVRTASIRSNELASICAIRVNRKPHVRLDGREWDTALNRSGLRMWGENLAGSFDINREYNKNSLSEDLFNAWWNSKGHRDNMMTKGFTKIGVTATHCENMEDGRYVRAGWSGFISAMILGG